MAVSDEVKQSCSRPAFAEIKFISFVTESTCARSTTPNPRFGADTQANSPAIVGLVGRLSIEKGVDIFLRAAARVLAELPSTKFVVVGEGPDRDKLESLIDDLKIRESVSMLGRRDDMPSVYASFDIMVSASRQEGLPIAILEGMASRLPLVATAVGEVPTLVSTAAPECGSSRGPRVTGFRNRGLLRDPAEQTTPWHRGKTAHRRRVFRRQNDGRLSPRRTKARPPGKDKVSETPGGPKSS